MVLKMIFKRFFLSYMGMAASWSCDQDQLYKFYSREAYFVLRFYGPVNPMGSCRARSVYLTTRLLGRLSPLSG